MNRKVGGLFEGLSMAQVVAGALAAVTSMLLSSQIGITGSVIGVAVGSIVSTVSSQLYKKFVQKGVDKVKDIASPSPVGPNGTAVISRSDSLDALNAGKRSLGEDDPALELTDPRLRFSDSHDAQVMKEATDAERAETGTTIVMPRLEDKRTRRHAARMKRNVIIVSIVASIIAVAASALIVNTLTAGNGLGYKTQPIIVVHHEQVEAGDGGALTGGSQETDDVGGSAQQDALPSSTAEKPPAHSSLPDMSTDGQAKPEQDNEASSGSAGQEGAQGSGSSSTGTDAKGDQEPESGQTSSASQGKAARG